MFQDKYIIEIDRFQEHNHDNDATRSVDSINQYVFKTLEYTLNNPRYMTICTTDYIIL